MPPCERGAIMPDIISVLVGGGLALSGGAVSAIWRQRRERRSLAYALAGEIQAIVDVMQMRKYQEVVKHYIEKVKETNEPLAFQIRAGQNYLAIYEANATKIGLLPRNAARRVARFYTHLKAFLEDVTDEDLVVESATESLQRLSALDEILGRLVSEGLKVSSELEKL
jgi:hypothetical protein